MKVFGRFLLAMVALSICSLLVVIMVAAHTNSVALDIHTTFFACGTVVIGLVGLVPLSRLLLSSQSVEDLLQPPDRGHVLRPERFTDKS